MKIRIPKPCHEDWQDMLPEDKGRFCLKCTKTVVDFSNSSKDEIKSFFKQSTENICGRFSIAQVENTTIESFSVLRDNFKLRLSKFAFAIYLVFGGFLFSCTDKEKILGEPAFDSTNSKVKTHKEIQILGKVAVDDTSKIKESTENFQKSKKKICVNEVDIKDTSTFDAEQQMLKGDVMFEE